MRNILYFQSAQRQSNRLQLAGVRRYAQHAGWRVNVVECASLAEDEGVGGCGKPDVPRLLDFWRPDGVIVECGSAPEMFRLKDFRDTPVIFLDGEPSLVGKGSVCIVSDDRAVVEAAVKELLRGACQSLAWVSWVKPVGWSERRGRAFREFARLNGKSCQVFAPPLNATADSWHTWKLGEWLRKLPKPCGILAANDYLAMRVLRACGAMKISVPDEVSVVGVDNDEEICSNAVPSLTSVALDWECFGYAASEHLTELMQGKRRSGKVVKCGVLSVVRRESTRLWKRHDCRVLRAVELIRRRACAGLCVADVAAEMGCSRRLAELRFREATDMSILEEITSVRLARAKSLLVGTSEPISQVACQSGYRTVGAFRKAFVGALGATPLAWRNSRFAGNCAKVIF